MIPINIMKHDGRLESFMPSKIKRAAIAAGASDEVAERVADIITAKINESARAATECSTDSREARCPQCSVDAIHSMVEVELMKLAPNVAKNYILYRQRRAEYRDANSPLNAAIARLYGEINRDNANSANGSAAAKMYSIAEAATKCYNLSRMDKASAANHRKGKIYIHDLAYRNISFNCFFNPIGRMLAHGFENGVGLIRRPKRIKSALAQVAIILQSSQNSVFGGQGVLNFDTDLIPYVDAEFHWQNENIRATLEAFGLDNPNEDDLDRLARRSTEEEVFQAIEGFVYNLNTMRARSGSQVPFSSVNFGTDTSYEGRLISKCLLRAYMAGLGNGENPIFPNLCYRLKDGVNLKSGDPNFDITELAIECVGKRIQPRFVFCDSHAYDGLSLAQIGTMGCRTAIRSNVNGDKSPDARGNLAFSTLNLPFLALEAKRASQAFAEADRQRADLRLSFMGCLDEALTQARDELLARYDVIKQLKKRDVPFVSDWYQGSDGLRDDDPIEPMVKNGTLSIGFIGLAECLKVLLGKHHGEDSGAQALGLFIVKYIRDFTDAQTEAFGLNFSTFATPAESACYTLLKACRKEFGVLEGVTDKDYLTNSFHLPVSFECDAKTKIDVEAPYHLLCNAGAIFYLESARSPKFNPEGTLALLQYMSKSGIVYGGLNWKHSFCEDCHYQGDFHGSCPKCGSARIKETAIVTGYLSEKFRFNDGKQSELQDRRGHLGGLVR